MKEIIDKASRWISDRTLSISVMIILATLVWIAANAFYHDLSALDVRLVKKDGKEFGEFALVFAFAAFAYYAFREFYTFGRKKFSLVAKYQSTFLFAVTVLRRLHIWLGVLAITFTLDHGYLLWSVRRPDSGDPRIESGFITLFVLLLLTFFGVLIRKYPAATKFRFSHRFCAFVFFVGYLIHKAKLG